MTRSSVLLVTISLALTFVALAPTLDAVGPTSCKPGNVFENEDMRIWFHGKKGFVKVYDTSGSEGDGGDHYAYHTGEIVETDADGARVARMNLERAYPQTSGCVIEETDAWVNMTLTVTDDVKGEGGDLGEATVTFVYHYNKTARGAKFDLFVDAWPWQSADGELSYAFDVETSNGTVETAENGVGFRDSEGASQGYIEWAPNATARYADGHEEMAIVDGEASGNGTGRAQVVLRFTNVTAGYDALEYDPWVGVGEYVIVAGRLVGLAPVEALLPRGVTGLLRALL